MIARSFWRAAVLLFLLTNSARAQVPERIAYQGHLTHQGRAITTSSGILTFRLYDQPEEGTPLWTETHVGVEITEGLFDVQLGAQQSLAGLTFDRPLWMSIASGDASSAEMAPRMALSTSPYSFRARSLADEALKAGDNVSITRSGNSLVVSAAATGEAAKRHSLDSDGGAFSDVVYVDSQGSVSIAGGGDAGALPVATFDRERIVLNGLVGIGTSTPEAPLTVAGIVESSEGGFRFPDGSLQMKAAVLDSFLKHLAVWNLGGNSGTDPATQFIGTLDDRPLELRVSGEKAMKISPARSESGELRPNVIAGHGNNTARNRATAATIGGGGSAQSPNLVGGEGSTVGGGVGNRAEASGAFVGGGSANAAPGEFSTVGGGRGNEALRFAAISGGEENRADGYWSAIGGGQRNKSSAGWSTVPGGLGNHAAGDYSFAAGRAAAAEHEGAFVWADASDARSNARSFVSTGPHQFLIRAIGGVGIGTNRPSPNAVATLSRPTEAAAYQLEIRNVGQIRGGRYGGISFTQDDAGSTPLASMQVVYHNNGLPDLALNLRVVGTSSLSERIVFMNDGRVRFPYADTRLGIGVDNPSEKLEVAGNVKANNVAVSSDARFKMDIAPLADAMELVEALRGVAYRWRTVDFPDRGFEAGQQYGFLAQEVQEVLPDLVRVGTDGMLSVEYVQVIPLLVEAIKQHQAQIRELTARVDALAKGR